MMKHFLFLFFCCIFFLACKKESAAVEDPLSSNRKKWLAHQIDNYSFTLTVSCFCPAEFLGPNRIKVQQGQIVEVNGVNYVESNFTYPTISELFQFIAGQLALNPQVANVQYNKRYGYPSRIFIDQSDRIADEEIDYTINSFVPQP